jgi:hypothetical protein
MRGQPPPPSDPLVDSAFEDLYRDCGSAVLGYALRRCASREDALDVPDGTMFLLLAPPVLSRDQVLEIAEQITYTP